MQSQRSSCVPWDCGVKQTNTFYEPKKPPHRGQGLTLIPFIMIRSQPCKDCLLFAQRGPHSLKRVYKVKRSSYLYSPRNFFPYPIWNVINISHTHTTSSLCPMGLRDQTNKQTNPHIIVRDRL